MFVARFKDSKRAVARAKTERAALEKALRNAHGMPLIFEVVTEAQHEHDRPRFGEPPGSE